MSPPQWSPPWLLLVKLNIYSFDRKVKCLFFSQCLLLYSYIKIITLPQVCPCKCIHPTGLRVPIGQGHDLFGLCVPKASYSASVIHRETNWPEDKLEWDGCSMKCQNQRNVYKVKARLDFVKLMSVGKFRYTQTKQPDEMYKTVSK